MPSNAARWSFLVVALAEAVWLVALAWMAWHG